MLDFFQHLRIWCFGTSFFYNLQEKVLQNIIWLQWQFQQVFKWFSVFILISLTLQKQCLDKVKENQAAGYPINLASDGKYDSPGEGDIIICAMDLNLLKLKDLRLLIVHTQFRIWRPRLLLEFMWLTKTRYYI